MSSQPSYYAVIPANVRYNKNLEPNAKLLYGEITALCNREGYCWANNKYFADLYDVEERTVQFWLESLKSENLIGVELIKSGFKQVRKIYLYEEFQKILTARKNFHARHENNFTHNNTCTNTIGESPLAPLPDNLAANAAPLSRPNPCSTASDPPTTKISSKLKKSEIPEEAKECAKYYFEVLKGLNPKMKNPNLDKWALELDKLHRIDKRPWEEIRAMIDWAASDSFWCSNILSPDKLRKQYDKIYLLMNPPQNTGNTIKANREIAMAAFMALKERNRQGELYVGPDYVLNKKNGDSVQMTLPTQSFEQILKHWFNLR